MTTPSTIPVLFEATINNEDDENRLPLRFMIGIEGSVSKKSKAVIKPTKKR